MAQRIESLDTNVLLRFILGDDEKAYRKIIALLTTPGVIYNVDDQAIIEAVYALERVYHFKRREVIAYIKMIFKPLNIEGDYDLLAQVAAFYIQHPKLSFNDCYLATKAKREVKGPLWTFDRKLAGQHSGAELV